MPLKTWSTSTHLLDLASYFGQWQHIRPSHYNQPLSQRYHVTHDPTDVSGARSLVDFNGNVAWWVLAVPLDLALDHRSFPMLLVEHPAWSLSDPQVHKDLITKTKTIVFSLLRTPAIAVVHPAQCALLHHLSVACSDVLQYSATSAWYCGTDVKAFLFTC